MIDRSQFQALAELRKVLVTCSNIRKLGLTCSPCFVGDGPLTLCEPGWQLPPLKSLKLRGMMIAATTALGWQDFMHWESLEVIECTDIDFFQSISASLHRLRSLEVHLGEGSPPQIDQVHALFDFVKSSRTLQNFCIAESLRFVDELELHLHLRPKHAAYGRPVSTIESIGDVWGFLWRSIERVRQRRGDVVCSPRLRTLRVVESQFVGFEPLPTGATREFLRRYRRDEMTFEARLSECDDLARGGHAYVVCLELEGLHNKYGRRPLHEELQALLMDQTTRRAHEARMQSMTFATCHNAELLRPLRTSLLAMIDEENAQN
ncbi:MAG: hypothetical protein Q9184_000273 [Pyrenodesmia sp. 2 TL-2023]